jgi:hypothetical protein
MNIEPKLTLREQANGMAFRKADTALAEWSNKFIAEIAANGQLSEINKRWFGIPLTQAAADAELLSQAPNPRQGAPGFTPGVPNTSTEARSRT